MQLEDKLEPVKQGDKVGYRLFRSDGKNLGLIRSPQMSDETEFISAPDFRDRFHEIIDSLENNMTGYTITVDDKPAACLFSKNHHLKMFEDAFDIMCSQYEKNGVLTRVRSRFSRFFNRDKAS